MSAKIGALTETQARSLELYGILPNHQHVDFRKPSEVLPKIEAEEARWVAPDQFACKYAIILPHKKWQARCGVMQLVDGVHGGRNTGRRPNRV